MLSDGAETLGIIWQDRPHRPDRRIVDESYELHEPRHINSKDNKIVLWPHQDGSRKVFPPLFCG